MSRVSLVGMEASAKPRGSRPERGSVLGCGASRLWLIGQLVASKAESCIMTMESSEGAHANCFKSASRCLVEEKIYSTSNGASLRTVSFVVL